MRELRTPDELAIENEAICENLLGDVQCPHPADKIQSGIYANGVNVTPVCMACGAQLLSQATIEVLEDIEHEEYP